MPLNYQYFPAGEAGFFRAPVLIFGAREAILIDGGFTLSDGTAVTEAIRATGRVLTAIYISQSDPDYYFSLAPIKAAFPNARVLAATSTIDAIKSSVEMKLATWGPQLEENGPAKVADIVVAEAFDERTLELEDQIVEIVSANGLPNRRYVWIPSLNAVVGGVLVFSGLHVWTADTSSVEDRAAWVRTLDGMFARNPSFVVAGHLAPGAPINASAIEYTKDYLLAFDSELRESSTSDDLIQRMSRRYPDAGMGIALQIGAKVAKGEMRWG